jgi:hypothetical protein
MSYSFGRYDRKKQEIKHLIEIIKEISKKGKRSPLFHLKKW